MRISISSVKSHREWRHRFFANTREDATRYILQVAQQKQARKIVKSKSMVTEEIGMNAALEAAGIEVVETDRASISCNWPTTPPPMWLFLPYIKTAIKFSASCGRNWVTRVPKPRKR